MPASILGARASVAAQVVRCCRGPAFSWVAPSDLAADGGLSSPCARSARPHKVSALTLWHVVLSDEVECADLSDGWADPDLAVPTATGVCPVRVREPSAGLAFAEATVDLWRLFSVLHPAAAALVPGEQQSVRALSPGSGSQVRIWVGGLPANACAYVAVSAKKSLIRAL